MKSYVQSQESVDECVSRLERERQAESLAFLATREACVAATKFSNDAHRYVLHLALDLARESAFLAAESARCWAEIANSDAETLETRRQVVKRASDVALRAAMSAVSLCICLEEDLSCVGNSNNSAFHICVEDCDRDVANHVMTQISEPLTVAVVGGIELSRCRTDRETIRVICDLLSKSNEAPRCTSFCSQSLSLFSSHTYTHTHTHTYIHTYIFRSET